MGRILVVENDKKRAFLLKKLVRERVRGAEVVVAESVRAAIGRISEEVPDLILLSALLPPKEEADLMAHVRRLPDAPYLQILTTPALAPLVESWPEARSTLAAWTRRPARPRPIYNRDEIGALIEQYFTKARELREQYEYWAADGSQALTTTGLEHSPSTALAVIEKAAAVEPHLRRDADARWRAERRGRKEVPWLSGIRLPWGLELQVVNISASGVLVESSSKLMPGSTADLHVSGPSTNLIVPARFVRSEVAGVDGRGVKYHAAAAFEREVDLIGARPALPVHASPQKALADLLARVMGDTAGPFEPARARFLRGLRDMARARDVQVRDVPVPPVDGSESIYFEIPGNGSAGSILQVMFGPDHDLGETEFRLLKAAACVTAAIIEFERPGWRTNEGSSRPAVRLAPALELVTEVA